MAIIEIEQELEVGELFKKLNIKNEGDYESPKSLEVETPDGYKKVKALKKTGLNPEYEVETKNNRKATFTDLHRLEVKKSKDYLDNRFWKFVKDLKKDDEVITDTGIEKIKSVNINNKFSNMFDLEVEENHCFYANGFSSHNTLIMGNLGLNAFLDGYTPVFITAETSVTRLYQRILSNILELNKTEMALLEKEEFIEKLKNTIETIPADYIIKQYESNQANGNMIYSYICELMNHKGIKPDILFVDYIGILCPNDNRIPPTDSFLYYKRVAEDLRNLGLKLDIPVISANQINREGMDEKGGSKAHLSGKVIAGSRGVYDTADVFMPITQTSKDKEKNKLYLLGDKSRNDQTGWRIEYEVDYPLMKLEEKGIVN